MLPQARQAATPPFSTPHPLIKPEPIDDPRPEATGDLPSAHPGTDKAQLVDLVPSGNIALPMSVGFKSAAQHSFEQHSKADGVRHSTGSLLPALSTGLPFFVPQPIQGPFAGTVFDPATTIDKPQRPAFANSSIAAAEQPRPESPADRPLTDRAMPTAALGDLPAAPADGEVDDSLAAIQQAAAVAAEQDVQAAEQFAAEALQSPKAEPCEVALQPVSTLHTLLAMQPACHGR